MTLGLAGELKGKLDTDEIAAAWQSKHTFGQSKGAGSVLSLLRCGVGAEPGAGGAASCSVPGFISGAAGNPHREQLWISGLWHSRKPAEARMPWPGQLMNYLVKIRLCSIPALKWRLMEENTVVTINTINRWSKHRAENCERSSNQRPSIPALLKISIFYWNCMREF